MENNNQDNYSNNDFSSNVDNNNNYQSNLNNLNNNNSFQENQVTNFNQNQQVNNTIESNQTFNAQPTNGVYNVENNAINNQGYNPNNTNQSIPNNKKKSRLPLIIVLIITILIVVVGVIVIISKDKKADTNEESSVGTSEAVLEKNENKKEKNSSNEKVWAKTLDWDNIPEKENDLVLFSTIKAPITIESFEKYVTDATFLRPEGKVTWIAISPDEFANSKEIISSGNITFCEKGSLGISAEGDGEDRLPLKDVFASDKYDLSTSYDLKSVLGIETNEFMESEDNNYFRFMVERYGRPTKVLYYDGDEYNAEFIWKRDGYYFSLRFLDIYYEGGHAFSDFTFCYVPEKAWKDYLKDDPKYQLLDFDEFIGRKNKTKKVTGDDSKKYIKESKPIDNIAIFNEYNYKDQNFRYRKDGNEYEIVEYLGNDKEIVIPNEANGLEVTRLKLYLPEFVEKMYISGHLNGMSLEAPGLKEIVFDENTVVDNLDITEYIDCHNLEYYYFPKCKRLSGKFSFAYFLRDDLENINFYFNSVEDMDDFEVVEAYEGNRYIFHVKDNPKLYKMLKEKGYTVYEE